MSDDESTTTTSEKEDNISDLESRLKRALADYDNLKKQTEKEKQAFAKIANKHLIENIVGIWEGLDIITRQMEELLTSQGLRKIAVAPGDDFDPQTMEAVIAEGPGEIVTGVIQPGYRLHGKVIRAARVKVGRTETTDNKSEKQE